jgi:putative heme-binding domain-containing protein
MLRFPLPRPLRGTAALVLLVALVPALAAQTPAIELKPGDRISLIGNTLADRMQHDGWLETYILSRFPKHDLVFRNLGYSGDELTQRLRSQNFGSPTEWLTKTKTDVVFAFFGYGESFAGAQGLDGFKKDLNNFLVDTKKQKFNGTSNARVVLFSPVAHEDLKNPHMPNGAENNKRLEMYVKAMAEVARANDVPFVDLFHPTLELYQKTGPLTINGVHLNEHGNHEVAKIVDSTLFPARKAPETELLEKIRKAVLDKNFYWYERYRTTDGFSIYGGRADLKFVGGQTNRVVAQREMEILDEMTANRDPATWAAAQGKTYKVDDSGHKPFIPVVTNKPGKGPGGEHIYLDGQEAIKLMTVGKNLKINLVASEKEFPELADPVQMSFDPQGRLWVAAWPNYPHYKPGDEMNDKLLVFDLDPKTGAASKMTVFADHLTNPTGFEFWNGGVIVAQAPGLLFLKDTTGSGKADVRTRILEGLDSADTHHTSNSFVLDPGGALYFQEGTFHHTQIETPWGPTVRNANAGVYRYEPRTQKIETYVNYGFANPHGHVFDKWGEDIVVDGTGANPTHGTLFSGQTADYHQRHGGAPQVYQQKTRPCAGTEILSSKNFPEEYQGNFLNCNVIGFQGILRYQLFDKGASIGGKEQEPLVSSTDPNFRPADVRVGPDGAVYFLDWQNPIIGHMQHNLRDPSRNHTHGRIYRIQYDGPLSPITKIAGEPIAKLLDNLKSPEDRVRYRTRIELTGRPTAEVIAETKKWIASLDPKDADYEHHLMEALWLHQSHDVVDEALLTRMLRSSDFHARAAATRVLGYWRDRVQSPLALLRKQIDDESPRVRLHAIRALSFFSGDEALATAAELLTKPTDIYLNYVFNETLNTLERRAGGKVNRGNMAATFLDMLKKPGVSPDRQATLVETVVRTGSPKELATIFQRTVTGDDPVALRKKTLDWLADAALTRKAMPKIDAKELRAVLDKTETQAEAVRLIAAWKASALAGDVRKLAQDPKSPVGARFAALDALARFGGADNEEVLEVLAGPQSDLALRFRAVAALARVNTKAAAQAGAKALADAKESDDSSPLVQEFLQRKKGAEELADALASHKLSVDTAKVAIRAMYLAGKLDPKLNAVLSKYAGLDAAIKLPSAAEIRSIGDEALAKGDVLRGERIFHRADLGCVKCHSIHKAGGNVGPDLGGVGSASPMDYIVQSILDPNASVKEEYLTKNIVTSSGQVITGIVVEKTKQYLVLKDAAGKKTKIATADIEEETKGRTLMPDGVTRILAHGELLDLIRFVSELGKPGPLAMPKDVTVKTWKRLKDVPAELAASVPTRDGLRDGVHAKGPEAFETVLSHVNGTVPLDDFAKSGPKVVYLVGEFDVTRPGQIEVVVTGPNQIAFWVNEAPFDKAGTGKVELLAGRNRITVRAVVENEATPGAVRVELRRPADSTIQFELPASE